MSGTPQVDGRPIFEVRDLVYRPPGAPTPLLQAVTATLPQGRVSAVVGPNGAGKSTLLRLLCGLVTPSAGQVLLNGRELAGLSRIDRARRVAYVPQALPTRFDFTVGELVATGRHARRRRTDRWSVNDQAALEEALQSCGLEELGHRLLPSLSGGELQRALIARCLAAQADVLVLDEPTASLDVDHTLEVLSLCRALTDQGRTVVVSLHDLDHAARWADFALVLDRGRLAATGTPAEALSDDVIRTVFQVEPHWLSAPGGVEVLHLTRDRPASRDDHAPPDPADGGGDDTANPGSSCAVSSD